MMAMIGRDPSLYGEHSGRRGGATAASEAGVSWLDLKRHGRWASDSAPQRYIEQTNKNANRVEAALANPLPSTSQQPTRGQKTVRPEEAQQQHRPAGHPEPQQQPRQVDRPEAQQQHRQAVAARTAGPPRQIWNEAQKWAAEQRRIFAVTNSQPQQIQEAPRNKLPAKRRLTFTQYPVSYTHLTLPTTPYV